MKISYLIVDDEPLAHDVVEEYCKDVSFLEKAGNCYDALEAINFLNIHNVNLIFLDLNMPKLKGFDFLRTIENPPQVIVTSAYKEYALEGFELNVIDYLLKPFSFSRFLKAVNKLTPISNSSEQIQKTDNIKTEPETLFFKGKSGTHQIRLADVRYIEANGNYSKIVMSRKEVVTQEKISDLEIRLKPQGFVRVHKSFIVPIEKVSEIKSSQVVIDEFNVPVGRVYKKNVEQLFIGKK